MSVDSRNTAIWKSLAPLEYMGIANPLNNNEIIADDLGKAMVINPVVVTDDAFRIKTEQRDSIIKLGYDKMENSKTLAAMDATTKRSVMALRIAANDYMFLVDKYISEVLGLIADAKDYALNVGKNVIILAKERAEIAEEKGAIYVKKVDIQIDLEEIQRKHVEIELLRAELAVAKTHTQLLMAEIDVQRAELRVIETDVKAAMAAVEKIQIEVNIEMVIADIITRSLTTVKYQVQVAEIAADFGMISAKLIAIEKIIKEKKTQLTKKRQFEAANSRIIGRQTAADLETQQKRIDEVKSSQSVQAYKKSKTANAVSTET